MIFSLLEQLGKKRKCENCGRTEGLCIHHKDNNQFNNHLNNLQILCRRCHAFTQRFPNRAGSLNNNYRGLERNGVCENCEKKYIYHDFYKSKHHFCSNKCYHEWQKKINPKITLKCRFCKKDFQVSPCFKNRKFCSLKCTYSGWRNIHAKKETN